MLSSRPAEDRPRVALAHRSSGEPHTLGLSDFDVSAITGFVSGDPAEIRRLVEDARLLAEGLAGPAGDGVRVRLLARTAAACRTQLRLLEVLLAQRVGARDFEAVAVLNRTLDSVAKRMVMVVKQLGVESSLRHRPSVVIKHAENVGFVGSSR